MPVRLLFTLLSGLLALLVGCTQQAAESAAKVPGAPKDVIASARDAQALVSWTAPDQVGTSPVASYTVTSSPGGRAVTVTGATLATLDGLTNGTSYTFTVHATNATGNGPESLPAAPVTPAPPQSYPDAPSDVVSTLGDSEAVVTWKAPARSGNAPITGYTVTATPGGKTVATIGELSATVAGLTNGTSYAFTVHATNALGSGPESAPSAAVTPATVPGAPLAVQAAAGNRKATVSWTAPESTGGSVITGYTVTASPGGTTKTTNATSVEMTGLTNGTPCTFTVRATNSRGDSLESIPSVAITPATVPGAPTLVTASSWDSLATVSWAAPADNGGQPILFYTVIVLETGASTKTIETNALIAHLTNGKSYTFLVAAMNALGEGEASMVTSAVIPIGPPGAPTDLSSRALDSSVTVSWLAPVDSGGSPVTNYMVRASPGGASTTTSGLSATVTGLQNGTAYVFTVTATNLFGAGLASVPSTPVIPMGVPDSPTAVVATPGHGEATVSWTAPVKDGGSAILSYTVLSSPDGAMVTTSGTSATVTGLTNGTSYTFTVKATNAAGTGLASVASSESVPLTVPDAPTGVIATAGDAQATVRWTAPSDTGGDAIAGYTVTAHPGGASATTTGVTSATVSGLTNGTSYSFTVHATNGAGNSVESDPSGVVIPMRPVSTSTSTLVTNVSTVLADGISSVQLTLTARDASRIALRGLPVVLTVSGEANQLLPPTGVTNAAGVFTTRLSSTHDGVKTVTATVGGQSLSVTVTFRAIKCTSFGFNRLTPEKPSIGGGPAAIKTGDFNHDGRLDLVIANYSNRTISVLLRTGPGTFASAANYGVGTNPISIVTSDFNEDGVLDLAVANSGATGGGGITVLPGNSDGTFGAGSIVDVGKYPNGVVAGDFNGDGHPDLAVANFNNTVTVVLGTGTGSFGAKVSYSVASYLQGLATGDVDGDGRLDLVVANWGGGAASVLLGTGTGAFGTAVHYTVGNHPYLVEFADLNGDGRLDIVAANNIGGDVGILLNSGTGTFGAATNYPSGTSPEGLTIADYNADGRPDIAVANSTGKSVSVFLGTGSGLFAVAINYSMGKTPDAVASGDLDGDGLPDLAVADFGNNNVTVLLNNGTGSLATSAANVSAGNGSQSVVTADFNGDGRLDLATANMSDDNVSVRLGTGSGGFGAATTVTVGPTPFWIATGDFNNDGVLDLVTTDNGDDNVTVLLGTGTGTFGTAVSYDTGDAPDYVVAADFNGDGALDLAVTHEDDADICILSGNGWGGFGAPVCFDAGGSPNGIAVGDFNGDGAVDLAVATGGLGVLLGNGNGTFGPVVSIAFGTAPHFISTGDFNGDGKLDVAVADYGAATVNVASGTGTGSFGTVTTYAVGTQPLMVAAGDFNGDGALDLSVTNSASNTMSLLLGTGSGSFGSATHYSTGTSPDMMTMGDFNSDGTLDLAVANASSGNVTVLPNACVAAP